MKNIHLCLIVIVGFISCNTKKAERMVDFGAYQVHIKEAGKGQPTVILEAGLGSGSDDYDTLQTAISKFTKVVLYDRPGLGESSESPNPRTLPVYVSELKELLRTEKIDPPYILIGHSLGGLIMRYYAYKYPEEVVGLILIESTPEHWFDYFRSTHSDEEINKFNMALDPDSNGSTGTTRKEWEQFEMNCQLIKETDIPQDIPIRIISSAKYSDEHEAIGYHPEDMNVWAEMQASFVNNSYDAEQIITVNSGHSIHHSEPELIIKSAEELVVMNRKGDDKIVNKKEFFNE